jgi:hypothetical protein
MKIHIALGDELYRLTIEGANGSITEAFLKSPTIVWRGKLVTLIDGSISVECGWRDITIDGSIFATQQLCYEAMLAMAIKYAMVQSGGGGSTGLSVDITKLNALMKTYTVASDGSIVWKI